MKFIGLFFIYFTVSIEANIDNQIDWSNVLPKFHQERTEITSSQRIVNGQEAAPHQFPYQIAVMIQTPYIIELCGGSIISSTAVLTAAHCSNESVSGFLLIAGAVNRIQIEPQQQRRQIPADVFIPHPEYRLLRLLNDVAVIRVQQAFILNEFVKTVNLASNPNELHIGSEVTVSGFGRYDVSHQQRSEVVRFTRKIVITNAQCASNFPLWVVDSTICAIGDSQINNSICHGDSGGPLTIQRNNESYQIGIVSFTSLLGCERGTPDGYARVSHFYEWIHATM